MIVCFCNAVEPELWVGFFDFIGEFIHREYEGHLFSISSLFAIVFFHCHFLLAFIFD